MIAENYQITDIIKQSQQKSLYRVQSLSKQGKKTAFFVKKFASSEKKYFLNQLHLYNVVLKDAYFKGFAELKNLVQKKGQFYIVLTDLGENIQILRKKVGGRFTLKTTLMIGLQIIQRIQYLHSQGYLHGDIQPSNFVTGCGKNSHKIYIVDFEFSSPFLINSKHISEKRLQKFSGSIRFCSLLANDHLNISRRDDLESLIYSMICLLKGQLPWFELKSQTLIDAYNQTAKIKRERVNQLLEGLPEAFGSVLNYVRNLKFQQKPNYERIQNQFVSVMKKNGYEVDYKYDWTYI